MSAPAVNLTLADSPAKCDVCCRYYEWEPVRVGGVALGGLRPVHPLGPCVPPRPRLYTATTAAAAADTHVAMRRNGRRCARCLHPLTPTAHVKTKFCPECREARKRAERAAYRARMTEERREAERQRLAALSRADWVRRASARAAERTARRTATAHARQQDAATTQHTLFDGATQP